MPCLYFEGHLASPPANDTQLHGVCFLCSQATSTDTVTPSVDPVWRPDLLAEPVAGHTAECSAVGPVPQCDAGFVPHPGSAPEVSSAAMVSAEKNDDMQRLGVFKEMSYVTVGDKFPSSSNRELFRAPQHLFFTASSQLLTTFSPLEVRSTSRPIVAARCR